MKKRVIVIVFLVLFVGVASFVYFGQRKIQTEDLYYSGTIEATTSELSFQTGGRVVTIFVDEGQSVKRGQPLAELDKSEYLARHGEATANLNSTRKNLQRLETLLAVYEKSLPADVKRADAGVLSAQAVVEEALRNKERYGELYRKHVVSEKEWESVKLHFDTAEAALTEKKEVLKQAESNLQKIETARKEIEVAGAQCEVAGAALDLTEIQLQHAQLKAPFDGVITSQNVELGEVVTAGREVFTLADLSTVELKIFVGETEIGKVRPGQKVDVKIDTFPDKVYQGFVSFVSPEGEFTPKVIQTHKERVKLVYLVKVSIANPNWELKSGMPADAWLRQ